MRVVNFGSLNIDYVYRVDHFVQPGETMSAQSLQIQCGGKGLNQSVALARAGVETWHAGLIGPEGHFLKETLDRAGVHTRFVEESAGSTGHAIIQVDSTGQNSILLHDGANGRLTPDFVTAVLDQFSAGDTVLLQREGAGGPGAQPGKRRWWTPLRRETPSPATSCAGRWRAAHWKRHCPWPRRPAPWRCPGPARRMRCRDMKRSCGPCKSEKHGSPGRNSVRGFRFYPAGQ